MRWIPVRATHRVGIARARHVCMPPFQGSMPMVEWLPRDQAAYSESRGTRATPHWMRLRRVEDDNCVIVYRVLHRREAYR